MIWEPDSLSSQAFHTLPWDLVLAGMWWGDWERRGHRDLSQGSINISAFFASLLTHFLSQPRNT